MKLLNLKLTNHQTQTLNYYQLLLILKWKLKRKLKRDFFLFYSKRQKALINDVKFLHCDLVHYVLVMKFRNEKEYLELIEDWLELETKSYKYHYPLKYVPGKGKELTSLINARHKQIDKQK